MSDYTKTTWTEGVTKLGPTNLNKIETGIDDAHTEIDALDTRVTTLEGSGASAGTSGALASRPAAAGASGQFYYATDQDVLYFSTGSAWTRVSLPAGVTAWFPGAAPTGWVEYDGTAMPASTGIYADLYAYLGNTTTKPNVKGRTIVGIDSGDTDWDTLLETRGAKTHTLSIAEMPVHDHSYVADRAGGSPNAYGSGGYINNLTTLTSGSAGGGGAHNNIQPSIVMRCCGKL